MQDFTESTGYISLKEEFNIDMPRKQSKIESYTNGNINIDMDSVCLKGENEL